MDLDPSKKHVAREISNTLRSRPVWILEVETMNADGYGSGVTIRIRKIDCEIQICLGSVGIPRVPYPFLDPLASGGCYV
jgi:hypothetical protein